jgi:threonine/homoserine/homoserine lactone efflux protein
LLYLAWRIATSSAATTSRKIAKPLTFMQAAAFQWVNGKGWVVALSAVTTYTVVNSTLLLQIVALSAIALLITLGSVCTWTLFGAMLRQYLHTERRRRGFNYAMAALLVASVIPVFWE